MVHFSRFPPLKCDLKKSIIKNIHCSLLNLGHRECRPTSYTVLRTVQILSVYSVQCCMPIICSIKNPTSILVCTHLLDDVYISRKIESDSIFLDIINTFIIHFTGIL